MPTLYIILICTCILISQTYGQLKCNGLTLDTRNFTVAMVKTSTNPTGCLTDTELDYIFEGEAKMWTIDNENPWLYFYVTENNKSQRYCTQLMKDVSDKCRIKYYRSSDEKIVVIDSREANFPKTISPITTEYSTYLRSGCDNQDRLEGYYSQCLKENNLEPATPGNVPTITNFGDVNQQQKCDNITLDTRNFTIAMVKTGSNPTGCLTDNELDYIFEGEAKMWMVVNDDPWLYFDVIDNNKTRRYCTPLMKDVAENCSIKYHRSYQEHLVVFDSREANFQKTISPITMEYLSYLQTGCENEKRLEEYFSQCEKMKANNTEPANKNAGGLDQHARYKSLFWYFIAFIPILLIV